jgi:hypothetical protein
MSDYSSKFKYWKDWFERTHTDTEVRLDIDYLANRVRFKVFSKVSRNSWCIDYSGEYVERTFVDKLAELEQAFMNDKSAYQKKIEEQRKAAYLKMESEMAMRARKERYKLGLYNKIANYGIF